MLRSLYSGVSGLRNHQVQMDVIGNNIANVNTVGFKSSRVTFLEHFAQALRSGVRPQSTRGGMNPMHVGQGSSLGTIDKILTQGNFERTDNRLDLAISGNAYFVLNNGEREVYTRAGNFQIDSEGYLVFGNTGFHARGRLADAHGNFNASTPITDVKIPYDSKAPARATSTINFGGNLDATSDGVAQILSASFAQKPSLFSNALAGSLRIERGVNDTLEISVDDGAGGTITETITLTTDTDDPATGARYKVYDNLAEIAAEVNSQIAANRFLAGRVSAEAQKTGADFQLKLSGKDAGGSNKLLSLAGTLLTPTDPAASSITFATTESRGTETTTALADVPFLKDLASVATDKFRFIGLDSDGRAISAEFYYSPTALDPATDPDYATKVHSVQDLLDRINATFSGATASLDEKGNILLTDTASGETKTRMNITFVDDESENVVAMPAFSVSQAGQAAQTHSSTINVYDSKGNINSVTLEFTNISSVGDLDLWRWEAKVNDGAITPTAGFTGFVKFNPDGSLASFESADDKPLTFEPGGGAETMEINIDLGRAGDFGGVTQFSSATSLAASAQNGYGMGDLYDIRFDNTGKVVGYYTNGTINNIAQIAVATFQNPQGLEPDGENVFTPGANSGPATKGWAGETVQVEIAPGSLEMSNVDLTKEFTEMIVAQRGFQANAKVINTSDLLLDEIVRLKR